jgi:WD40 repeat protein
MTREHSEERLLPVQSHPNPSLNRNRVSICVAKPISIEIGIAIEIEIGITDQWLAFPRCWGSAVSNYMLSHVRDWAILCVVAVLAGSGARARGAESPDLTGQAMSLLRENCITCHSADKRKGGLSLSSRAGALAGGEDGKVLVPGDAGKSLLTGALDAAADPHMPPKHQLTPEEIKLVQEWVKAGAAWDEKILLAKDSRPAPTTRPVTLHDLPPSYRPVLAVALSPDGTRLAAGIGDGVTVYDLSKKQPSAVFEARTPRELVYSLAWSADGSLLASGGFRQLRLWDLKSQEPVAAFEGFAGRVTSVAFGADGKIYAGDGEAGFPGVIRSWELNDRTPSNAWVAHADAVFSIRIAADGTMYTAGGDKLVKAWDLKSGKEIGKFEGHVAQVMAVAVSPDGTRLASAGADREIKVWDRKTAELKTSLATNIAGVTALAWADNKTVVSTSEDGTARLSSIDNKDRAIKTFAGANDVLSSVAAGKDGRIFAAGQDGVVYEWSSGSTILAGTLTPHDHAPADTTATISFVNDVLPVLSRAGCNAGSCHAKPNGQAGFKLSVFAFDPKSDYRAIVKGADSRRIFAAAPEESLLLKKPTLTLDHGGGRRLEKDSDAYSLLVKWIQQGMPYEKPHEATLVAVEVEPREGRYQRHAVQKLKVKARYSDGATRDATELADYISNEKEVAKVSEDGVVRTGVVTGETAIVARYMGLVDVARVTVPAEKLLPDSAYANVPVNNFIDRYEHDRLKTLGILPSETCTDGELLRRAYLDIVGTLPTPAQSREFLDSTDPQKRSKLIDRLLADPRYADVWAQKWADLLRPNPFRAGVKSVYIFDHWLRDCFRQNMPWDKFAREILTAQGSTHRDGPVVVYRDRREPADITTMFSQVFLGVRLECAKCHHHPNEKWSQDDFYQFAAFFSDLKRKGQGISAPISGEPEYVWFAPGGELTHPVTGQVMKPRAPDAQEERIDDNRDPREALADWMTRSDNPFFAKALVNRVWGELMGRGIVQPVDDMRVSNPATNDPLLTALAADFASHGYDIHHLIATIMRSRTYQASSIPNDTNVRDTKNFSRWYRRRPSAEALMDAVTEVTGVSETLPGLAPGSRAAQVWNNRLDSDFLDAFSRPNASADPPCERDRDGSIVQALHLMNSTKLAARIADTKGRAAALAKTSKSPDQIVEEIYLAALCRYPTEYERNVAVGAFTAPGATRQTATEDVMWALLNSAEFVFNH